MINIDYLYTSIYDKIEDLTPLENSTYFYSHDIEMRTQSVDDIIKKRPPNVKFVEIKDLGSDIIQDVSTGNTHNLRSSKSMYEFIQLYEAALVYIDITGLEKRIVAALLNNTIKAINITGIDEVRTVYAEPASYKIKQFQSEGVFHDLSEKIDGINPLPGFASIFPENIDNILFIALLGFEGGRFMYVLEEVQPPTRNVIPVVGIPGFRPEYPFIAYWGNRKPLTDSETWRNVKYAAANSLVDVYMLLTKILLKNKDVHIKLAPIGTKPHLLGAILFAIKHPKHVELIYDNPKRMSIRTDGVGKIVECSVSKLLLER